MKVLWVTSFNKKLYSHSGQHLLQTWKDTGSCGSLLATYDNFPGGPDKFSAATNGIQTLAIDKHPMLLNWLKQHADIIPTHLGGTATRDSVGCKCPDGQDLAPATKHTEGCPWQWFNRIASLWFRKVVSLHIALTGPVDYDVVVWIDSDCKFIKQCTEDDIEWVIGDNDVCYLRGANRKIAEGGLVIYNLQEQGEEFFRAFEDWYLSGRFRDLVRWDDSYLIWMTVIADKFRCLDFASQDRHDGRDGHVVSTCQLGKFISHNKGHHGRKLRIMG